MCRLCLYSVFYIINLLLSFPWKNALHRSKILPDAFKQSSDASMLFLQIYCIIVVYSLCLYFPNCKPFIMTFFFSFRFSNSIQPREKKTHGGSKHSLQIPEMQLQGRRSSLLHKDAQDKRLQAQGEILSRYMKQFFMVRTIKYLNKLLRETGRISFTGNTRTWLARATDNLI